MILNDCAHDVANVLWVYACREKVQSCVQIVVVLENMSASIAMVQEL